VLIVTGRRDPTEHTDTWKSFRNLPHVLMVQVPTTYRVLAADVVVLTREALAEITRSDVEIDASTAPPAAEPTVETVTPETTETTETTETEAEPVVDNALPSGESLETVEPEATDDVVDEAGEEE
jgi:hypothetical protein